MKDGLGAVIKYRYDVRGNRIYEEKAINPEVRQIIHFVHDKAGRLIERREELDSGLEPVSGEYKTAVTTHGSKAAHLFNAPAALTRISTRPL